MTSQKQNYDEVIAKNYDSDRENEDHWSRENEYIANYFSENVGNTILDVPVGTGRFFKYYPSQVNIFGVDISPHMIEQAREKIIHGDEERYFFHVGNAKNLDFAADNSVDAIVCCRLFHLIEAPERVAILKEFSRVMRGELILQVYLALPQSNILTRLKTKIKRALKGSDYFSDDRKPWSHIKSYALSEKELMGACEEVGLTVVKKTHLCNYSGSDVSMIHLRNSI